ncbi:PucR family transcriptional regulator [Aeromicrobium sp. Sec7.5]|uniref:PucR family transcriptional regulator n=1 Tax=Aeromicrobium sp. Sec7.5 TaxID=3121276 RepID=UPI002FE45AD0
MLTREDLTAGELAERLTPAGIRLLAGPAGTVVRSATCTVHDPLDALPPGAAGVLLGVGVPEAQAEELLRDAGACGFDAVVLRREQLTEPETRVAAEAGIAVLGAHPEMAWLQVERVVSSVLTGSARSGDGGPATDLFDFANSVAAIVGGAVSIEDLGQRVLAYSTVEGQVIDEDRRVSILGRQVPVLPENDAQYAAVLAGDGPVHIEGVGVALDRLAVAIRLGQEVLGTIWIVDADGSLDREAGSMLQRAAELAAVQLLQVRTAAAFESERRSSLVRTVIRGGAEARVATQRLGLSVAGPFVVLTFVGEIAPGVDDEARPDVPRLRWQRFLTMVQGYATGWIPAAGVDVDGGAVYVLLHGQDARDAGRTVEVAEVLVARAAAWELGVRAGIGSVVESPEQVRESRLEADALGQVADEERGTAVLSADRDHGVLALWWLRRAVTDRPGVLSPSVVRLWEHDARHATDFVGTWAVWFAHGMDTARSAAALSIHPNTLRYRLRRAAEISGLTGRPDDLLVAWLTVRLAGQGGSEGSLALGARARG